MNSDIKVSKVVFMRHCVDARYTVRASQQLSERRIREPIHTAQPSGAQFPSLFS